MIFNDNKIIYYYQTFTGLQPLIQQNLPNVHIFVSSLHFGTDSASKAPYIHLNNKPPDAFPALWKEVTLAHGKGMSIHVMLGGAGSAYQVLFSDFDTYYGLLRTFLQKYPFIQGIDLDVEEGTHLADIQRLIRQLHTDFGSQFVITMAPLASSLMGDGPGMGGFSYKRLLNSPEGQRIAWFNVQCYGCYTLDTYHAMVANGYPATKLVLGMLGSAYTNKTLFGAMEQLREVHSRYLDMCGTFLWEYGDTPVSPILWGCLVKLVFEPPISD